MFLTLLPIALKVLGWVMGKVEADAATHQAMADLVKRLSDNGLISVEARDVLTKQRELLKQQLKENKNVSTTTKV